MARERRGENHEALCRELRVYLPELLWACREAVKQDDSSPIRRSRRIVIPASGDEAMLGTSDS
eukprot:3554-Prymnesium_polylepis.1